MGKKNQIRLMKLVPAQEDQEREVELSVIDALIARSANPRFVQAAQEFKAAFLPGDKVIEYCTSKSSWDACMGSAGFVIKRDDKIVALLTCKMN